MLNEQQFTALLESVSSNIKDREILIRIDERLDAHLKNYVEDRNSCTKLSVKAEQVGTAAHRRIDRVITIGGWTVFLTIAGMTLTTIAVLIKVVG